MNDCDCTVLVAIRFAFVNIVRVHEVMCPRKIPGADARAVTGNPVSRPALVRCPISNLEDDRARSTQNASRWATRVAALFFLLGGARGVLAAQTAGTSDGAAPSVNVFAAVPADRFPHAMQAGSSCSVDLVNNTAAQDAAIDHLGSSSFEGWVGDKATGKVPAVVWLVLDGAQDFYVQAHTGIDRPDVAAVSHNPAFGRSGYRVSAYLTGIPVGDYHITIYYRIEGKEMICPTNATVSIQ